MHTTTLIATVTLVALFAQVARADHRGKITWTTPERGFRQAEADRKPMMVFFTADW